MWASGDPGILSAITAGHSIRFGETYRSLHYIFSKFILYLPKEGAVTPLSLETVEDLHLPHSWTPVDPLCFLPRYHIATQLESPPEHVYEGPCEGLL